jgi:hypothetical protein
MLKPVSMASGTSFKSIGKSKEIIKPGQVQCVVANDDHFQLMAVTYNLKACKVNIQMEG